MRETSENSLGEEASEHSRGRARGLFYEQKDLLLSFKILRFVNLPPSFLSSISST